MEEKEIKWIGGDRPLNSEQLKKIFEFQKKLQKHLYDVDLPGKNPKMAKEYAVGIFTELGEAMAIDKSWKSWKHSQVSYDEQELREEIADIWLFCINFSLAHNMDFEDVMHEVQRKQEILIKRHLEE